MRGDLAAKQTSAPSLSSNASRNNVVDQCNLRCAQCCSLSPHPPARFTAVEQLQKDLSVAAKLLAPQTFKLTGGEPFLHPQLTELLDVARASEVAQHYSATTNGFLAATAPDSVFERLDRMTLSLYSSAPLPLRTLERLRARCREHDIVLSEKSFSTFQRITPEREQSAEGASRAFSGCWMKVRCHLLHEGRFFTCTRPPHLDAFQQSWRLSHEDGVDLHQQDVMPKLLQYLERSEPLSSCRRCLGNSAEWEPHQQLAT